MVNEPTLSSQPSGTVPGRTWRWLARRRLSTFAGLLAFGVLVLAACGGSLSSSGQGSPSPGQVTDAGTVRIPSDFQISVYSGTAVLGGDNLAFSSLLGQGKPVVLNFWAGLCPPCRAEMPDIQSVYHQFQDSVTIFGLDVGPFVRLGSQKDALDLLAELGVSYPTGTTLDGDVVRAYRILNMPTTLFLTPDGEEFRRWPGPINEAKLAEITSDLLEASKVAS